MTYESSAQNICNCLDALWSKAESKIGADSQVNNETEAVCLELRIKVHVLLEKIELYPSIKENVLQFLQLCDEKKCSCDHLTFLQICLVLLRLLQNALSQDSASCSSKSYPGSKMVKPRGLLSISQQKVVKQCFQFIVGLGILPNLLRGNGITLSRRIHRENIFENINLSHYQKHVQLVVCLETLLDCFECDAMRDILFSYHGTDLLASLLQLCHAPIKKIESNQLDKAKALLSDKIEFSSMLVAMRDDSSHSDAEVVALMSMHRQYLKCRLDKLLSRVSPSLLIGELLILNGIPMRSDVSKITMVKSPAWLRKICNHLLTSLILHGNGIVSLLQAALDKFDIDVETSRVDVKQLEAVAHIITLNSVHHISLESYMHQLSGQVFQLLHQKGSQMDYLLKFIASCVVLQFYARDKLLGEKYFFKKILHPLWMCVLKYDNLKSQVVVGEKDLSTCIEEINQIFVSCTLPLRNDCISILFPLFHCLCTLYIFLDKGTSFLKTKVKEILIEVLGAASNEEALRLLNIMTIPNCKHLDVYQTSVSFANGDEGGVIALQKIEKGTINLESGFSSTNEEEITYYRTLLNLVSELHNEELNKSFVLLIIKEYCNFLLEVKEMPPNAHNHRVYLSFSALLQELSEWDIDIDKALFPNISEVVDLLTTLLENICNYKSGAPFYKEKSEVVWLILSILITSENHTLTTGDWLCIKKCMPMLQKLQKCDIDSDLKEKLLSVSIPIATQGAAGMNDSEEVWDFLKNEDFEELGLNKDAGKDSTPESRLEEMKTYKELEHQSTKESENMRPLPFESEAKKFSNLSLLDKTLVSKRESKYKMAIEHIRSSEIPICGSGLILLNNLIHQRDEETIRNKEKLLKIFQEHIHHEDTYIYMPAIQGISQLADLTTESVLPIVLDVYQNKEEKYHVVLKMGEVLLKICGLLGDMIYKYRDQILHACLIGTKHLDPLIRSSNLSILGESCKCLKFNIGSHWLQEIIVCVLSFLRSDNDVVVRRSAVMVISLLVRGVGKDMLEMLENDIHTLYKQLKLVREIESDEILCLHAQEALKEIHSVMNDLLLNPIPLIKEIRMHP